MVLQVDRDDLTTRKKNVGGDILDLPKKKQESAANISIQSAAASHLWVGLGNAVHHCTYICIHSCPF